MATPQRIHLPSRGPLRTPLSRRAFTLASAATLVSLAACSGDDNGTDPAAGGGGADPDGPADEITFLTSFGTLGRDAYAFLAVENGTFTRHNFEVTIEPGTGVQPGLQLLLGGQAQFGVMDFAGAVLAAGQGTEGFTTLAAIHQRNLSAVMTNDPSITNPRDLEGKTIGFPAGAVTELLFPTYCSLADIDLDSIQLEPLDPQSLGGALAAGQVDAIGQFVVGQPLIESITGGPVTVLPYSEYITDLYGIALITTVELAESDPELCVRFRDALLEGLQAAMDDPAAAAAALVAHYPDGNEEVAAQEMELMVPYVDTEPGVPLGAMDPAQVTRSIGVLQGAGAAPAGIVGEDLVTYPLTPGGDDA